MVKKIDTNHTYWHSRNGRDYRRTHEIRLSRGATSYASQENWLRAHLDALRAQKGRPLKLLDFGCGYGRIAHLCGTLDDLDYFAYDFSNAMVEPLLTAPPAAYASDISERVKIAPRVDGLFEPETFDVVLTISVLIHNDEADAKELIRRLDAVRRRDGELILMENVLVDRTAMVNAWHGGCWSHDFSSYIGASDQISVEEGVHDDHAIYVISDLSGPQRYIRKKGDFTRSFQTREAFLEGAWTPSEFQVSDPSEILIVADIFDRREENAAVPTVIDPNVEITEAYRLALRDQMISQYIGAQNFVYGSEVLEKTLYEHIEGRFMSFKNGVLPWLLRHGNVKEKRVVEIGSGTGASTLALVAHAGHVECFEIHAPSVDVADFRLKLAGYSNYTLHKEAFSAATASQLGEIDGVFLGAVLEHTTFEECTGILRNAWSALKPGGWICVADTPNRFCTFDYHTAILPFFSMLPPEVRLAYASQSPRTEFANAFSPELKLAPDIASERLTRWGSGISYHEFELSIGSDVHQHVVADGYEDEIVNLIGILPEDSLCQLQMNMFAKHVHRAFSRRALYLILRKPGWPA